MVVTTMENLQRQKVLQGPQLIVQLLALSILRPFYNSFAEWHHIVLGHQMCHLSHENQSAILI